MNVIRINTLFLQDEEGDDHDTRGVRGGGGQQRRGRRRGRAALPAAAAVGQLQGRAVARQSLPDQQEQQVLAGEGRVFTCNI